MGKGPESLDLEIAALLKELRLQLDSLEALVASRYPRDGRGSACSESAGELTPREIDVLLLIVDGRSNRQISTELRISGHTVRNHIQSIFRKLGVGSRTRAVVVAVRQGLIEVGGTDSAGSRSLIANGRDLDRPPAPP